VLASLDVDLVLADPPYGSDVWPELLAGVAAPVVVAEADAVVAAPEGWQEFRSRRYGRTWVTFLERATD
jgi:16S rRNA (guanine966-N2)-methyltransferase